MLIDALRISAFRGIQTEMPLDLTARLTLLHAPNGTGKTSVCDAIEWVFSGEVHRLSKELPTSPTEGVRNLFAGDRQTFVEADLVDTQGRLKLRQIGVGSGRKLEQATPLWRTLERNQLLQRLTPSNLTAGSTRRQNQNRIAWFRAVRLLQAQDLDLLLDDTGDAPEIRSLLFSNLFGISELQSREQTLQGVLGKMMPPRRIETEAAQLRTQIQEIETTLSSAGEQASEPFWAAARHHLATAAQCLGRASDADSAPEQLLSVLESIRASEEDRLHRVRSATDAISREWDRFEALPGEISATEKTMVADSAKLSELRLQHEALVAGARRSAAAAAETARQEQRLRGMDPARLASRLNEALAQWRNEGGGADDILKLSALHEANDAAQAQNKRSEQQRACFESSAQDLPHWLELIRIITASKARITQLEPPTPEAITANDRSLISAQDALRRIEAESSRLAAPLERLKSEGLRLIEHMPEEHWCPLCAHDHESAAALRAAIDAGLKALPVSLAALAAEKTRWESIVAESAQRKSLWAAIAAETAQLKQAINDASAKLRAATEVLHGTGADLPDLNMPEFFIQFQTAHKELLRTVEAERRRTAALASQLAAGELLSEVHDAILALSKTLRSTRAEGTSEIGLIALPLSLWPAELAGLTNRIALALQQVVEKARIAGEEAQANERRVADLAQQLNETTAAIDARKRGLGEQRSFLLRLQEVWTTAAGDASPSKQALGALPQRLAHEAEHLGRAAVELGSAAETIAKAQAATAGERQAVASRGKLGQLRDNFERLIRIQKRRSELDNAVSLLRGAKENFINQQIQPLCNVISALYLRAQSNSFVTAIGTDDQSSAHRWTATVGDQRLEAIAQFSQGQRQDLALAIFLARARDLRGTFILDEPLVHLDDLNRVALLDVFRVLLTERAEQPLRLVITTASNALVRHFREKFSLLRANDHGPALRIYKLSGNPRDGVAAIEEALPSR